MNACRALDDRDRQLRAMTGVAVNRTTEQLFDGFLAKTGDVGAAAILALADTLRTRTESTEHRSLLTTHDVAERLKASPDTVLGWIHDGQLKAANLGGKRPRYLVTPDDLAAFLKGRQPQPPARRKPRAPAKNGFRRFSE